MYHSLLLELIMVPEARLALTRLTFNKEREGFLLLSLNYRYKKAPTFVEA
ncbi:hypothetical protein SHDE107825_12365 [Shewanella denitrificans]|jgi:hypothetical protein